MCCVSLSLLLLILFFLSLSYSSLSLFLGRLIEASQCTKFFFLEGLRLIEVSQFVNIFWVLVTFTSILPVSLFSSSFILAHCMYFVGSSSSFILIITNYNLCLYRRGLSGVTTVVDGGRA